jgi:hypothetical protein
MSKERFDERTFVGAFFVCGALDSTVIEAFKAVSRARNSPDVWRPVRGPLILIGGKELFAFR